VNTAQLIVVDLSVAAATSIFWASATVALSGRSAPSRGRARLALAGVALGALGLIGQIELTMALGENGWWFAQEKLVFSLPLTALATVLAVAVTTPPVLTVAVQGSPDSASSISPSIPAILMIAAAANAAGVAARLIVGFPMTPAPAAVLVCVVALVGWVTYAVVSRSGWMPVAGTSALLVIVLVLSLGFAWHRSLVAFASPTSAAAVMPAGTSITDLREPVPDDAVVRHFDLRASQGSTAAAGATGVAATSPHTWSFGSLPGPELRVTQGEMVEAKLTNVDVPVGVTLHWHGYPVPGGDDGVAGVTQNAVQAGDSFLYRFTATDTGTYWYHSHSRATQAVERGLFGTLVVLPPGGITEKVDITLAQHTLGGTVFLGSSHRAQQRAVTAGDTVRVRLVNTDPTPTRFRLSGAEFVVAAVDGRDIAGAGAVRDAAVRVPSGGRADVTFVVPPTGVRVTSDATATADLALTVGTATPPPTDRATPDLDLLSYGTPSVATVPHGTGIIDAEMVLDQLPRFFHGEPQKVTTVGGAVLPYIPALEVREGNSVRLTVVNRGFDIHPLHVHGHQVRVISRNGVQATGAPLWLDSFDVQPGEVLEVGFAADNPGIWTDRSTDPLLPGVTNGSARGGGTGPAASELLTITYRGVTSPFQRDVGAEPAN
jgi:FtsP/CotA-like multicopper oxidase with cupredoxin domain